MIPALPWWVLIVVLAALIGLYLSWTAGRLDRLHARIDGARSALEAQLFRRSGVAAEVASSGMLDPATALLIADAASRARASEPPDRDLAESALTRALDAAFDDPELVAELAKDPGAEQLIEELGAVVRRVEMARRFHNDTVAAARVLRGRRRVRWFRLAGHAAMPETIEFDDSPPRALAG